MCWSWAPARDDLTALVAARCCAAGARSATGSGYTRLAILDRFGLDASAVGRATTQGTLDGPVDPGVKKRDRDGKAGLQRVFLVTGADREPVERGARLGTIVAEARTTTRTLVNLPPNDLTPARFAEIAVELAGQHGLRCRILDETRMRSLGMGALLGVAAGSAQPPRLICLETGDDKADARLAFVGKGLTFDSGGLSIKTAQGMETMKSDMGGGAAVLGGMLALARVGIRGISVRGYIGATENMSGPSAMRPGDVLTAMNGETIEVLNTDAEGRLVLADVLAYAVQEGATHVVDFATLTGGAMVALGSAATLAVGRPSEWVAKVVSAADRGLERAWQMPLYDEYRRAMDSEVADIKNTGGRLASALTAAAFLGDFVSGVPWAHMDIAGTAFAETGSAWRASGGTGEGVGTIVALATGMGGSDAGEPAARKEG